MNKSALTKHEIYNKLDSFSEEDLLTIADFVDFMWNKKCAVSYKLLKLQGILKDHDIDLSELKHFKDQTWQHVDQEFANE